MADQADQGRSPETKRDRTLTDRQGHPIEDNQNLRTIGDRGPTSQRVST